jgi:hypothetical protein
VSDNVLQRVLGHAGKLVGAEQPANLPEQELLGQFLRSRDESVFALLVERHGPMVYGTAIQPIKGNPPDFPGFFGPAIGGLPQLFARCPLTSEVGCVTLSVSREYADISLSWLWQFR